MKKEVSIGLLGLGVVGSGVIKLIHDYQEQLNHQLGCSVRVKSILVRDLEKAQQINVNGAHITTDFHEILEDPDIDIIVEVMGGIDTAHTYITHVLQSKKSVITANKDLIALRGPELLRIAEENEVDLFYEASVGGGIPLLRSLSDGLVSDNIQKIMGIVNGTTNYILTKMDEDGTSYEDALKDAQQLGFAESDPTADVEGLDAAYKMVILARLAFLTNVDFDDVEVEGISSIDGTDLSYAKQLGYTMKLIGYAECVGEHVDVHVQPTLLAQTHPLASVKNEYNAVYVNGEAVGETMFYGPGAGSLPTATAVMSDVAAAIRNLRLGVSGHSSVSPRFEKADTPKDKQRSPFFIRIHAKDEVGAFASISQLFNKIDVSLERIIQKPKEKDIAEIVLITHTTSVATFEEVLKELKQLDVVTSIESHYRVEGDES
ncbi:MAG TPA: homoserine dehydrogenase [Bacillota bacterium]|nr:homoserine dehydrogenase [Bacillota bacterium]